MHQNDVKLAINTLIKVKKELIENMVEELIAHKDTDPTFFSIQEIEDKYSMRLSNLNTLLDELHEELDDNFRTQSTGTHMAEAKISQIQDKIHDLLAFVDPMTIIHMSVVPKIEEKKYLIILVTKG